jgi:chemotaxis regulatin CheY-phosphate phosphatase CheZ
LLQNALDQIHRPTKYDAREWQSLVSRRLASIDIRDIAGDVQPFLEHPQDASLLTRENLSGLFSARGPN